MKIRILTIVGRENQVRTDFNKLQLPGQRFANCVAQTTDTPILDVVIEIPENWNQLLVTDRVNTLGRMSLTVHQALLKVLNDNFITLPETDPTLVSGIIRPN